MKKIFKLVLNLTVLLVLVLALAGCGGNNTANNGEEGKTYTIKVANYFAEDHPQNIALKERAASGLVFSHRPKQDPLRWYMLCLSLWSFTAM